MDDALCGAWPPDRPHLGALVLLGCGDLGLPPSGGLALQRQLLLPRALLGRGLEPAALAGPVVALAVQRAAGCLQLLAERVAFALEAGDFVLQRAQGAQHRVAAGRR